jgi:hypothetical protein
MQTKKESLWEVVLNIGSGYVLALITQWFLYPLYDLEVTWSENMQLAAIFMLISIIRSYFWRRYWNRRLLKKLEKHYEKHRTNTS